MTMRSVRQLAVALLAAACAPAAPAMDLVDAWRAAASHDAEHAAARAAQAAGESRRTQASALWRPVVALEASAGIASQEQATRGARFSAPGFGTSTGVDFDTSVERGPATRGALTLRQPLIDRDRDVQGTLLRNSADAADLEWIAAQQGLVLRTAERYFDAALAAERLRLIARQQSAVDRALVEARDRYRIGDRPIVDSQDAAARSAALKAQRLGAETQLELRRLALADLTGEPVGAAPLPLPRAMPAAEPYDGVQPWLDDAARASTTIRLAETRLRAAEQEARRTSDALSPSVSLVAQYGRDRLSGSGDFGSASNTSMNSGIALQLSLPNYSGGLRQARQVEAQRGIDQAAAELEHARRQVLLSARSAWHELAVGHSRIEALEAASAASTTRLDATRTGREVGDRTTLDLLNAENDAAAAELSVLEARVSLLTSRLRLMALAGRLDEERLLQINAALR